jgi:peptidyl-prolyl cis-trans isomerase SurA
VIAGVAGYLAAAGPLAPGRAGAEEVLVDGIAAQVGTEIVLLSEVQALAKPVEDRMRAAGAPATQVQAMHADALERLIEAKLVEGVVRRLELEATDAEIDAAVSGIAQDNGLTLEQLQRSVADHGLDIEEYRGKIKSEIERSKVLNAMVRSRVRVEPSEVEALFEERYGEQHTGGEQVHLRHIMVGFGGTTVRTPQSACVIAREAERKIKGGEINFADMARRVTDMSPEKAGDLGWLHADDMAAWMRKAIEGMQPGDVSDVIETGFGCNLLQLVERRSHRAVTIEDVEQQLIGELSGQKMEQEYIAWLDTIAQQTYVSRKGLYSETQRIEAITGGDKEQ